MMVTSGLFAAESSLEEKFSVRKDRKIGFQVLHMGAPFEQWLGVGGAVNIMRQARVRVIYAPGVTAQPNQGIDTLHTVVGSLDGFLFDQPLSPMLSIQSAVTRGNESVGNVFGQNARHFLLSVGADFLRSDGLNAGVAVNLPINEPVSGFNFYLGWYSDLI